MFAYKLNGNPVKCRNCGEALPPYVSRYHKVILFTEQQKEVAGNIEEGEYVEYNDQYLTIDFDSPCKDEGKTLSDELKAAQEEIDRMAAKIKQLESNQPIEYREFK